MSDNVKARVQQPDGSYKIEPDWRFQPERTGNPL